MTINSLSLANALSAYNSSSLGKTTDASSKTTTSNGVSQAKQTAAIGAGTATTSTQTTARSAAARLQLNMLQQGLAKDIKAALTKAGKQLTGTLDFTLGSDGKLTVSGNDKDKASIAAVLNTDKSTPSLTARLTSLHKQAEAFDRQSVQANALSTAARYAGKNSQNLLAMYQSLMSNQSSSTTVFSMSDKTSQVAFKGAVATTA